MDHETSAGQLPEEFTKRAFLLREAEDAGVSRNRLRTRHFTHPTRSVYAPPTLSDTLRDRVQMWQLVLPDDAALFGKTAAEWYDVPAPRTNEFHIIVPVGGTVPVRRASLVPHEGLGSDESQIWRDVRICVPEIVFLQLATELSRTDLVVMGDQMVGKDLVTPERLRTAATLATRRRGVVLAREAAALVRPRVDSPPETRTRLILVQGGLPCPETGIDVFDDFGGWIGRPDLAYLLLKLALQYEGDVHRTDRKRWRADIRRDEVFFDNGWDVIRLTGDDLGKPTALCERVRIRMRRQAVRLGVPLPLGC
jgi:hypothetical protein